MSETTRPDYGLDAPGVVRNLILVAVAGVALWGTAKAGWWSGDLAVSPSDSVRLVFPIGWIALWPAATCAVMAAWMVWDSKVGKVRNRERLLDLIRWTGAEYVLDVGCGRGLMLIGAAKRLTTGTATGVDIWQAEDLSGNKPEATLRNAELEGVNARVDVKTADMRNLPFADGTFDVVVSCAAIHNLYAVEDRATAIREIARVLKQGGRGVIDDIRHHGEYTRVFSVSGCAVERRDSRLSSAFLTLLTMGSLRPATLVVSKTR